MQKNDIISLTIDGISSDGNAVGHYDGKAIFVPNAAVGDLLSVRIVKDQKSYAFGKIENILNASPFRQAVDCDIANQCGGCCFRHLTYQAELEAKKSFVQDALNRIGKIDFAVEDICPSPSQDRYRNKVQIPIAEQNGTWTFGFYANHSHRIVPCNDCLLQPKVVNQLANRTAQLLKEFGCTAYDEAKRSGLVRTIYIRQGGNSKELLLCIVATQKSLPKSGQLVNILKTEFPELKSIVLNVNAKNTNVILGDQNSILLGDGFINDTLCDVPIRLGVHSFSQVNTLGAEKLFAIAKEYANLQTDETLLDLYCGAGIIGLSMAEKCKSLIGVEIVPEAIENAKHSAEKMKFTNTRFLCADAAVASAELVKLNHLPDVIVVDPPRKGCDETTLQSIISMSPSRIVMVSCNPATMARDIAFLVKSNYTLQKVKPVDMFPRTKHVECVVLLHKKSL